MGKDFWFRVGVIGLGALPVALAVGSLLLK
jgi:hypothetical protein